MSNDTRALDYIQAQIHAAEGRIKAEIERIAELAEFRELTFACDITTRRRLNAPEKVDRVDVRIRAVL